MANPRLIGRLDIKGANLIKGIQLEGLRVVGDPHEHATRYYQAGLDELIFMDVVASLYGRNNLSEIIQRAAKDVFIPITVGGGIRSLEDVRAALNAGADKVAINTAAIKDPGLITRISRKFGAQCMVLSIEAKRTAEGKWEAYTDNGREHTGRDAVEWAIQGAELGSGEILVTSVDREGTRKGFDLELIAAVTSSVPVPVIASGGMGELQHLSDLGKRCKVDAVAMADALHYSRFPVSEMRKALSPE